MTRLALALIVLALLIAAPAASAHGGATVSVDYRSVVTSAPDGVDARIVGGDDRVAIRRDGAGQVVILGYDGEPYLRIDGDGVWENQRSPAVGINAERGQGQAAANTDPAAPPEWTKTSSGDVALFHDHRAHWMGSQPPAAVREDRGAARRLADWAIPLTVDGQPGAVQGYYRYEPPPPLAAWLGAGAAMTLLFGGLAVWLRGSRRRLALWILTAVAVLPAPILGAGETLDLPDSTLDAAAGIAVYLVLVVALAAAARWARRDPAAEAAILAVSALAVGALALVGRLGLLEHAVVPSALPAWLARSLLVVGLAATLGVAAGAVATWRETLATAPAKGGRTRKPRPPAEETW